MAMGGLYESLFKATARAVQSVVPKESQLGRHLARASRWVRPRPLTRIAAVLRALSEVQREVRFIQIGASDGLLEDPLHDYIVRYAWRGILVEPLPHLFEQLKRTYAAYEGLAFENAAISVHDGVRDFYYVGRPGAADPGLPAWHTGLGSLSREVVLSHAREYPDVERHLLTRQVACLTFDSLCQRHGVSTVDVIAIDAEGHDFEILNLIDVRRYHPLLLIYEHYHMTAAQKAECGARLRREGYDFFEEILNTICLNVDALGPAHRDLLRTWNELRPAEPLPT